MLEGYDDLLTVEELCEILKMGHNTVYSLLNRGIIKAFRNGRTWRISKKAVIEYILKESNMK